MSLAPEHPQSEAWQQLNAAVTQLKHTRLTTLFQQWPQRAEHCTITAAGLTLDYAKNFVDRQSVRCGKLYLQATQFADKRADLLNGGVVNSSEKRAAHHTALRQPSHLALEKVVAQRRKMQRLSIAFASQQLRGFSQKPLDTVLTIGIGGSQLGPELLLTAFAAQNSKFYYFLSNLDSDHTSQLLQTLDPQRTLVIISSKTFTTEETLVNAKTVTQWLRQQGCSQEALPQHLFAVTASPERAKAFGIAADHCLEFWDWVGGRYSIWSAIALPAVLILGMERYEQLLAGAHAMDEHFATAALERNMPVIMALLTFCYQEFWQANNQAVIPYCQGLYCLPAYLQQLDMESSGKSVTNNGQATHTATGGILWGGIGTNGQHAFHQLLHQGKVFVPVDFILPLNSHSRIGDHHVRTVAHCFAQSQALLQGKSRHEIESELLAQGYSAQQAAALAPHKVLAGNKPSNTLLLPELHAYSLGALLALYEHKIFTLSCLWDTNPFDQWGVELGKQLSKQLLSALSDESPLPHSLDGSSAHLIKLYQASQGKKSDS